MANKGYTNTTGIDIGYICTECGRGVPAGVYDAHERKCRQERLDRLGIHNDKGLMREIENGFICTWCGRIIPRHAFDAHEKICRKEHLSPKKKAYETLQKYKN